MTQKIIKKEKIKIKMRTQIKPIMERKLLETTPTIL